MEKTVRLNADQREDLVAYLDGELPDEQVQQIDRIIAGSEVARHEVEALREPGKCSTFCRRRKHQTISQTKP